MAKATVYSEEIASAICERLACGESLRKICGDEKMPALRTVFDWLADDRFLSFRTKYAHAREAQADTLFDEILDIADTPQLGEKTKTKPDGEVEVTSGDMIDHRRLQIETRKWMASKLHPKKYGDKLDLNVDGQMTLTPQIMINGKSG